MVKKCINIITVRGTYETVSRFYDIAHNVLCNGILLNDTMGNIQKYHKTFTVYTYLQMPKMELMNITLSMPNTQGLVVRIVSDEPWNDYYEIAEYKDGVWSFETEKNIEKEFPKINQQGFELIRKLLKGNGTVKFSDWEWTIDYYDPKVEELISDKYRRIELSRSGKVTVITKEQVRLSEKLLNTCHIADILWIIEKKTTKSIK